VTKPGEKLGGVKAEMWIKGDAISRRSMILGGSALLGGCASTALPDTVSSFAETSVPLSEALPVLRPQLLPTVALAPPLDPQGRVRPDLMQRAMAALDSHYRRVPLRDRMYIVDFRRFSGDERLFEVDLYAGHVVAFRTSHGRGSDPRHSGYAQAFSNRPNSHMSCVGAFATSGAGWGPQHGPNVLLDGLDASNDRARDRAIIVHGADYADPEFLAREGKLGRSFGCFTTARNDLPWLRQRMGQGRLLFAFT